jgi:hypothetical protein
MLPMISEEAEFKKSKKKPKCLLAKRKGILKEK